MTSGLRHPFVGLLLCAAACHEDSASSNPGTQALVTIVRASPTAPNPQFVPGALPAGSGSDAATPSCSDDGGVVCPATISFDPTHYDIRAGQVGKPVSGSIGNGTAVAIGFTGDAGYWIVPAGDPDLNIVGNLVFAAKANFSRDLTPGNHALYFRGVSAGGDFGPPASLVLNVQSAIPDGDLVISLTWDTESDLDLHVVPPNGVEVWSGKINSIGAGMPEMPGDIANNGVLDVDSNGQCVIDGRRMENIVWKHNAPPGHYIVRVDAWSLCGQSAARWKVTALLGVTAKLDPLGSVIGKSSGTLLDAATRFDHTVGSGITALEFDLQ